MIADAALRARLERGESQRQIAAAEGCSQATVRHWMRVYGLNSPRRRSRRLAVAGAVDLVPAARPLPPRLAFGALHSDRRNTNATGAITEARVLAALTSAGFPCYVPFGVGKADLVIETSTGFKTVQSKTARLIQGGAALMFHTVSRSRETGAVATYVGSVDYFGVGSPDFHEVYLVPVDEVSAGSACTLRLRPARNGQTLRCRDAADFLVRGDDSEIPMDQASMGMS